MPNKRYSAKKVESNSSRSTAPVPKAKAWELGEDNELIKAAWKPLGWSSIATTLSSGDVIRSEADCRTRVRYLLGELQGKSVLARDVRDKNLLWELHQATRSDEEQADDECVEQVIRASQGSGLDFIEGANLMLLKLAAAVFAKRRAEHRLKWM